MNEMFQAPAIISGIKTMADNSLRLQIDCQEMPKEQEAIVLGARNKYGWFLFKENNPIETEELTLPDLPEPKKNGKEKSDAQRLRAVIYLLWKQGGEKDLYGRECDDETYYHQYMSFIIEKAKSKLKE